MKKMSAGDYIRRSWINELFTPMKDDIILCGLVIIDVASFVYDQVRNRKNKNRRFSNSIEGMKNAIDAYLMNVSYETLIFVMPNQKTRNCYYQELDCGFRYNTDNENYSMLRCYSDFMRSLEKMLRDTYENDKCIIYDRDIIAMENEIVMTLALGYLKHHEDNILVYNNSPDMFIFSLNMETDLRERFYFRNLDKLYLMDLCFIEMGATIDGDLSISSYLHYINTMFVLFGNMFTPMDVHIYMSGIDGKGFKDIFLGLIKRYTAYVIKYSVIPFSFRKGTVRVRDRFKEEFIFDSKSYKKINKLMLDQSYTKLRVPMEDNIFGIREKFVSIDSKTQPLLDDIETIQAQSLLYILRSNYNYYKCEFNDINTNIFYDSQLFNTEYLKGQKSTLDIKNVSNDKYLYSSLEYILRTFTIREIISIEDNKGEVLTNISNSINVNKSNSDIPLRFLFPSDISVFNAFGEFMDPLSGNKAVAYRNVIIPYRPLILYYINSFSSNV